MSTPEKKRNLPLDYAPVEPRRVPAYRKVFSGILVFSGIIVAGLGLLATNGPARTNIWTAAGGLIIWGLVIRFQHVRL